MYIFVGNQVRRENNCEKTRVGERNPTIDCSLSVRYSAKLAKYCFLLALVGNNGFERFLCMQFPS